MAAIIGFLFIWKLITSGAPNLKIYIFIYRARANSVFLCQSAMDSLTADEPPSFELYKVFSTSLNTATTWFALSLNLCSTKPSVFCSSSTVKLFPSEYACTVGGLERGRLFSRPIKVVFSQGVFWRGVRCDSFWNSSWHFKAEVAGALLSGRSTFVHLFVLWIRMPSGLMTLTHRIILQ